MFTYIYIYIYIYICQSMNLHISGILCMKTYIQTVYCNEAKYQLLAIKTRIADQVCWLGIGVTEQAQPPEPTMQKPPNCPRQVHRPFSLRIPVKQQTCLTPRVLAEQSEHLDRRQVSQCGSKGLFHHNIRPP